MKIRKTILLLTALCGLLAGCGSHAESEDEAKEQVHLIVKTPTLTMTYSDEITESYDLLKLALDRFVEEYDEADVTYELVKFAYTDVEEYIGDAFDTENATDILFDGYLNMATYIH
ncbi:MAG: hypothetical protein Q4D94_09565, partial [Bacillota bacterium]|nr:hypothetical protein [Bacillota bacterium]